MTIADDPATLSPGFKSVGTRPIRPDGFEKVTGRAKFGADLKLPGMLEGAIVRSPHAHARIVSIDTTEAASMPGVKAIITGADFPEPSGNPMDQDLQRNTIARDKAFYEGHVVAAVAASTRREARAAAAAIKVTYEVLPHVLTVDEAMAPGAPVLHADMMTKGVDPAPTEASNVASRTAFERRTRLGLFLNRALFGTARGVLKRVFPADVPPLLLKTVFGIEHRVWFGSNRLKNECSVECLVQAA